MMSEFLIPDQSVTYRLDALEEKVTKLLENQKIILEKLNKAEGVAKHLHRVIVRTLIQQINYDGIKGKIALKANKAFNIMLFEAIKTYFKDGYIPDSAHARFAIAANIS